MGFLSILILHGKASYLKNFMLATSICIVFDLDKASRSASLPGNGSLATQRVPSSKSILRVMLKCPTENLLLRLQDMPFLHLEAMVRSASHWTASRNCVAQVCSSLPGWYSLAFSHASLPREPEDGSVGILLILLACTGQELRQQEYGSGSMSTWTCWLAPKVQVGRGQPT